MEDDEEIEQTLADEDGEVDLRHLPRKHQPESLLSIFDQPFPIAEPEKYNAPLKVLSIAFPGKGGRRRPKKRSGKSVRLDDDDERSEQMKLRSSVNDFTQQSQERA